MGHNRRTHPLKACESVVVCCSLRSGARLGEETAIHILFDLNTQFLMFATTIVSLWLQGSTTRSSACHDYVACVEWYWRLLGHEIP